MIGAFYCIEEVEDVVVVVEAVGMWLAAKYNPRKCKDVNKLWNTGR